MYMIFLNYAQTNKKNLTPKLKRVETAHAPSLLFLITFAKKMIFSYYYLEKLVNFL
jgi:hypothetical protein